MTTPATSKSPGSGQATRAIRQHADNSTSTPTAQRIDTAALHSRVIAQVEEYLGHLFGDAVKRAGQDKWRVGKHGSLAISIDGDRLVFYSHEDGTGGDAVALWQRERGGTAGDALKAVGAFVGLSPGTETIVSVRKPRPAPEPKKSVPLTPEQIREAFVMVRDLYENPDLCERIAASRAERGWKADVIRKLAKDGSLGIHGNRLAFIYQDAIKLRWSHNGERRISHHCGAAHSLWRGGLLAVMPEVRRVYIAEGETDCITMLSEGWEQKPDELVVAIPCGDVIPADIGETLAGLDVTIVPDMDSKGEQATQKLLAALTYKAASLKVWRLK